MSDRQISPWAFLKNPDFCSLSDTLGCYLNQCAQICDSFQSQINAFLCDFCLLTVSVNNMFEVNRGLKVSAISRKKRIRNYEYKIKYKVLKEG